MAKIRQWLYLKDEEGVAIENASLNLYLYGTETEATIFSDSIGTLLDQSTWTSGTSGFFDFYIGNEWAPSGYAATQTFDLEWSLISKSGVIENWQLFPFIFSVDETDTNTEKNKVLSNELAYQFDQHGDASYLLLPHNIEPVDTSLEDVEKNKVVSNVLISEIEAFLSPTVARQKENIKTILLDTFTPSGDGYYTDLVHTLDPPQLYPEVQFYEYLKVPSAWGVYYRDREPIRTSVSAGSFEIIQPLAIQDISPSAIRVYTVNDNWLMATVAGSGAWQMCCNSFGCSGDTPWL